MSLANNISLQEKMKSRVRKFTVELGDKEKASKSLLDKTLYKEDGNELRIIQHPELNTWTFQYKNGILPAALKEQKFTNFQSAFTQGKAYLEKQGLKVTGAEDVWNS